MKKSFTILELMIVILLLGFLYTQFLPKNKIDYLDEAINRLSLYLSEVRYKALIDDKFDLKDNLWHKKRWTLKFFRCRDEVDGIYYSIYSNTNESGTPSADDSLKDPLTQKNIYSSNQCKENNSNSKYVLVTKNFEIKDVKVSCNETTSLGQLSFGSDGKVYAKLSAYENEASKYEITQPCSIKFISKENKSKEIILFPSTGYTKLQ